ncbi:methylenetetrahydrofolate reductase [NAD(P)H] [Hyphomicrobium methylovorum]|uniref:methylenetetrahydrofolate reductase [NAD(P)H] n=1 Tax=Hyphomicrobium methylovorum TaxID=84 RepID=UPI0031B5E5B2
MKVSFEFYPPRTETMERKLWSAIKRLEPLSPVDVAVTYGSGEETRARTRETTARILQETKLKVAAHLTCVSATREELDKLLKWYWSIGVRHIVALRGDAAVTSLQPDGYANSTELVRAVSKVAPFDISVAAYPEKHPDSPSMEHDIDNLKRKIDDGATHAITQYFFDNDVYFRFLDRVRAAGIQIPITPGILPIHNLQQVAQVAARCRVHIPHWLTRRLQDIDDGETRHVAAAAHSAEQVLDLVDRGVQHVHFFTLNRADLVYGICHMIGLRASSATC